MGLKASFVHRSKIFHIGGGTLNKANPQKTFLNFKNGISLLAKNLPYHQMIWKLPMRFLLDWAASLMFLKNTSSDHFLAIWKAHFHSVKDLSKQLKHTNRSKINLENKRLKLIPYQYYICRKKTYRAF